MMDIQIDRPARFLAWAREFSDEGRKTLIRQINRPAGERVEVVNITVANPQ